MRLVELLETFLLGYLLREHIYLSIPRTSYFPICLFTNTFLFPNSDYVAHLDGFTIIPGGWLNGHYIQLAYQLADSVSGFTYSFGGTCIILAIMNLIPGLSLRATDNAEHSGIDDAEIGEFAVCPPTCVFFRCFSSGHPY